MDELGKKTFGPSSWPSLPHFSFECSADEEGVKGARDPRKTTIERETHARGNGLQRYTRWAIALTHDLDANSSMLKVFLCKVGMSYDMYRIQRTNLQNLD